MHLVEGQCIVRRRHGVAGAWLHIVPPAVVSPGEANHFALARVVARQTHRLHDRLGARHVKRDLVFARDLAQHRHVFLHAGVIRTEHRAQVAHQVHALLHAALVEVGTKQVDAVTAGDIQVPLLIGVGHPHPFAVGPVAANLQVVAQELLKLERHPVARDQLHVRHHGLGGLGQRQCLRAALGQGAAQSLQSLLTLRDHRFRGVIHPKPLLTRVVIGRCPVGKSFGPTQMPRHRGVLGQRQLQALPQLGAPNQRQQGAGQDDQGRKTIFFKHVLPFQKLLLYFMRMKQ